MTDEQLRKMSKNEIMSMLLKQKDNKPVVPFRRMKVFDR